MATIPAGIGLRLTSLARTRHNCKRQTHPLIREDDKDYESKYSVKEMLVMCLKQLATKTNWLAVNRQS
jgi:hypothetical protein